MAQFEANRTFEKFLLLDDDRENHDLLKVHDNEGFDVPEANVAVILGGRRGKREHLQRVGRILRWKENQKAKIYELVCNGTMEVGQANRRGAKLES